MHLQQGANCYIFLLGSGNAFLCIPLKIERVTYSFPSANVWGGKDMVQLTLALLFKRTQGCSVLPPVIGD